ncbi:unnamed protein product [Rangifer tarandus platyrhynchus]|uniref:Uncharacterized protein n=2 Tax=Rangifer tarandus platyrhynchus TaxID=3082113 RepID=A0ABN8YUE8_RANTA|nr:unnamed protein product [Rangifer tarandus platyrhynchus]
MKGTKSQVSCSVIKRVPTGLTAGSHHGLCPWPSGCPLLCPLSHAPSSSLCASLLSHARCSGGGAVPASPWTGLLAEDEIQAPPGGALELAAPRALLVRPL